MRGRISERQLKKSYYDPTRPGSYSGASSFYKTLPKKTDRGLMQQWLDGEDAYTLHKKVVRKFPRRSVICPRPYYQIEADLIDMNKLSFHNKQTRYLLTVVDCFSKYGFVRGLKNKTAQSTVDALADILREMYEKKKKRPTYICSDRGSEFYSKKMRAYLKRYNIHLFSTNNRQIKASLIERFNRTLENRLYRYMTANNTKNYISVLQDIVTSYNNTYHSSIGLAPNQVTTKNSEQVWNKLYPPPTKVRKTHFKVGDFVRIQRPFKTFDKGYLTGFLRDKFLIVKVLNTTPVTYEVSNKSKVYVKYAQELARTI